MKQIIEATLVNNQVQPRHEVEIVCKACGYDLTPEEIQADTCADCNADLELQQNMAIHATSVPAAGGGVM
jgi:predicted Zn-ribbon and HTH transcriptional regulator